MKLERGLKHQVDAVNSIVRVLENVNIEKTNNLTSNPVIDLNSPNIVKNINICYKYEYIGIVPKQKYKKSI